MSNCAYCGGLIGAIARRAGVSVANAEFHYISLDARALKEAICDVLVFDHPDLYQQILDLARVKTQLHQKVPR